jgi:regulator of RNase E activity RraA
MGYACNLKEVFMDQRVSNIRNRFAKMDCASLCDASPLVLAMSPGLQALHPDIPLVGRAFPVMCSNDYLTVIKALSEAKEGDVLVVDGRNQTHAVFGELLTAEAKRKGLAGAIIDGAVRDLAGMRSLHFPIYYRYVNPQAGRADIIEPPAAVVSICGISVTKGDWVLGDADGIVVIPDAQIDEIISVAEEIEGVENKVFESVTKGESLTKIMKFEEFRREHEREIRNKLEYHLSKK